MALGLGLGLPSRQKRVGQFDPLTLFAGGEQGAWYAPSDLSTLFQDSAGTTPVTADGQPVGLALDKSGNGNHASQATATARPLYRTDGTRHWLEFDGVDDSLSTAAFAWGSSQTYYGLGIRKNIDTAVGVFAEFSVSTITQNGSFAMFHSNSATPSGFGVQGRGTARRDITATSGFPAPISVVSSAQIDLTLNTGGFRLNGGQVGSTTAYGGGAFGTHAFYLGSRAGTSFYLNGRIYGAILRNVLPTAGQLSMIERYLASKSGVVLS